RARRPVVRAPRGKGRRGKQRLCRRALSPRMRFRRKRAWLTFEVGQESLERFDVVRGAELIDEGQRGAHASRLGPKTGIAEQRVTPEELLRAAANGRNGADELGGVPLVETIGEDDDDGLVVDAPAQVMLSKAGQAVSQSGAPRPIGHRLHDSVEN